jgi:hypothetical protein
LHLIAKGTKYPWVSCKMLGSEIYSDFNDDANWIRDRVREDLKNLPYRLRRVGEKLTSKRLMIITDGIRFSRLDPELGRPVPYTIFWFADAFGFTDRKKIDSFALAMVYSSLVTTLRDDAADIKETRGERSNLLMLSDIFQLKYLEIFERAFERGSSFWRHLALAMDEQLRYESWNRAFTLESQQNPFSARYLEDSSRYFSAVVMPSLAALAVASDAEDRINEIARFLRHFSMGWRVYDDLKDWRIDLGVEDMNHSCFLLYARQFTGRGKELDEGDIMNLLIDETFIRRVYRPILLYFRKAKEDILPFNSRYLTRFMDEQLSFHTRTRDEILKRGSDFFGRLEALLNPRP